MSTTTLCCMLEPTQVLFAKHSFHIAQLCMNFLRIAVGLYGCEAVAALLLRHGFL
jgi:hypothetical protein